MAHTLVLLRHARASDSASTDFERPLSPDGIIQSRQVGDYLASAGIAHALVSAAERARQTFANLRLPVPAEYMRALYDCSADTIVSRIGEIPEEVTGLLVVAHAPAIPQLASRLAYWAAAATNDVSDVVRCHFGTADYQIFQIEQSWAEFAEDFLADRELHGISRLTS